MSTDRYNEVIAQHLSQRFGMSPEVAAEVLDEVALCALNVLVFHGSVNTPFGRMAAGPGGLAITEQNLSLIKLLAGDSSREEAVRVISSIVEG